MKTIDSFNKKELVTIVVVTYNSSLSVLNTLESAYRQTYRNIELIVSDDCSTDETFQICKEWINVHKERFVRTICTQTLHNKGICWNYNHALKLAKGDWIKYIAGDDILWDNCILQFIENIRPNIFLYYCGQEQKYEGNGKKEYTIPKIPNDTAKKQLYLILRHAYGTHGATLFANSNKLIATSGFDEKYQMIEDGPITYKFLVNQLAIGFLNKVLVTWNVHCSSVSHCGSSQNVEFTKNMREVEHYYRNRYCLQNGLLLQWYHSKADYYIATHYKKGFFAKLFGYSLRLFDILFWYRLRHPVQSVNILQNYNPSNTY